MKVKFADKVFEVLYTKEVAGLTMYAVEDEPNHIDWLVNVEVIDTENDELKKNEQKPADKVEPKFGIGDKIQYSKGCGTIMTIEKIENGEYIFANNMGHTTIENGNKCHLVNRKPTEWSEEDEKMFKIVDTALFRASVNAGLGTIGCPYDDARDWLESLKGRVRPPKQEWSEGDEKMYRKLHNLIYSAPHCNSRKEFSDWLESLKCLVQPKQEWSEEDESYLNTTIAYLKDAKEFKKTAENCINWLESLKGRVRPPKQKWSEEDKKMIFKICQKLYNYPRIDSPFDDESFIEARKEVEWISSLNQNNWKPSEEQLRALDVARCNDRFNKNLLNSLYNDLKKLNEE